MAIISEGHGFFSVAGVKVDSTRAARSGRGMTPTTESPLAKLHEEIFTNYDEARKLKGLVKTMLSIDDEARRQKLLELDTKIANYFTTARVGAAMDKVRGIMADDDLTPEAKQKRALAEVEAVAGRVRSYFAGIMGELMEQLSKTERLVEGALLPLPKAGQDALIREIRAAEVRGYIAGLDKPDRMGAVLQFGEGAKLEALAALFEDPRGRDFVPAETLNQARKSAITAQGGKWLLDWLEDDRNALVGAASRMSMLEALLWEGAKGMRLKATAPPELWTRMASEAVRDSDKVLNLEA